MSTDVCSSKRWSSHPHTWPTSREVHVNTKPRAQRHNSSAVIRLIRHQLEVFHHSRHLHKTIHQVPHHAWVMMLHCKCSGKMPFSVPHMKMRSTQHFSLVSRHKVKVEQWVAMAESKKTITTTGQKLYCFTGSLRIQSEFSYS